MKIEEFDKFKIVTLKNGLKALIYHLNEVNSVSILAIVRAGHFSEQVNQNGIAHILEHMIFDGTQKFTDYKKLNDFFDTIAGTFSGSTSYDFVTIGGNFVEEEFENALVGLEQLLFKPLLSREFLTKEKGIVLDELSTLQDNNDYKNYIITKKARFKSYSILARPLGGTVSSIKNITHKQIINYHNKFFVPGNIDLVIVGKCNPADITKLLNDRFAEYEDKDIIHPKFSKKQFSTQKVVLTPQNSKKSYIRITFPSFNWKDSIKDRVALAYICSLFANRRDSLLYSKLREENGWIYDINCDFLVSFDIGVCEIETSTPLDKSLPTIESILKGIKVIKTKEFEKNYFEKVKSIDKKRLKMVFDTPEGIIKWFSEEIFYRYPNILLPKDLIDVYDSISTKDLKEVACKIFSLDNINICLLQNLANEKKQQYKKSITNMLGNYI